MNDSNPEPQTTDDLLAKIGRLEQDLHDEREGALREIRYLRQRQEPVYFLIDRGNYNEMIQMMGPVDQERVREMMESQHEKP